MVPNVSARGGFGPFQKAGGLLWLCSAALAMAARGTSEVAEYVGLDLDALAKVEVVSVSKRPEYAWRTPAAVHVVTADDIGRSVARSLPEALRYVPGVEVGALSPSRQVVTIRGFADEFANKLLVLVDGRSVYTPVFGGVYWDTLAIDPADVQQIEVVRGPGGATWGVNAVNGVINVVTRHARDTLGTRVSAEGGNQGGAFAVRHGAAIGGNVWWRAYARVAREEEWVLRDGSAANDAWEHRRAGIRVDGGGDLGPQWTLQAERFLGEADWLVNGSSAGIRYHGGHLLGRLHVALPRGANLRLFATAADDRRNTLAGFWHGIDYATEAAIEAPLNDRLTFRGGAGARLTRQTSRNVSPGTPVYTPETRRFKVGDGFAEARYANSPRTLEFTVGLKAEYNDFTGWEALPATRAAWTPTERTTIWAGVASGARIPSISDHDARTDFTTGTVRTISEPNPDLAPEKLVGWSAGWRWWAARDLTFDVTAFVHDYRALRTRNIGVTTQSSFTTVLVRRGANLDGSVTGGEISGTWQVRRGWRLIATGSRMDFDLGLTDSFADPAALQTEGRSPRHQASLRSRLDLGRSWQVDLGSRYVDSRPAYLAGSYVSLDLRVAWQMNHEQSWELLAENLADASRFEVGAPDFRPTGAEVPRRVTVRFTWRR